MASWWNRLPCVSRPANAGNPSAVEIPMLEPQTKPTPTPASLDNILISVVPNPVKHLFELNESTIVTWSTVIAEIDANGKTTEYFLKQNSNDNYKSILHYVSACPEDHDEFANILMDKIVEKITKIYWKDVEWFRFLNLQTSDNLTALHYAVTNKHKRIVEFLLMYGADVSIRASEDNKKALPLIYNRLHVVVVKLFDDGFEVIKDKYDLKNERLWKLKCNFSAIAGVPSKVRASGSQSVAAESGPGGNQGLSANRDRSPDQEKDNLDYCQSFFLTQVLCQQYTNTDSILLHPLSQIFLNKKGKKMFCYIFISMLYHITWSLLLACYFGYNFTEFHEASRQNQTCTSYNASSSYTFKNIQFQILTQVLVEESEQSTDNNLAEEIVTTEICMNPGCGGSGNEAHIVLFGFVIAFYLITLIKEIIEGKISPSNKFYIHQFENWGQIIVLILVPVSTGITYLVQYWENSSGTELTAWRHFVFILNTIGMGTAIMLIQGQVTKSEWFGIYNQMLLMVFLKFVKFLLAFVPMLIAFLVLFYRLLPDKQQYFYDKWSLGFNKVLAMMTGELTYNELFSDESTISKTYWIQAEILFFFFLVLITVMLQNLLLGLTVSDVEKLRQKALVEHLASRLEVIYLTERILSSNYLKVLMGCCGLGALLECLLNKSSLNQKDFHGLLVPLRKLPKQTRKLVIEMFSDHFQQKNLRHEPMEVHFKPRSEGYYSKPLQVKVVKPLGKIVHENDIYRLDPRHIGLALVLNITKFKPPYYPRNGAENDTDYMCQLWNQLGYKVLAHTGYFTKQGLDNALALFLDEFIKQPNQMSCVVYLGGHLNSETQQQILSDGSSFDLYKDFIHKIAKHEVLSRIENQVSKPKIFIINSTQPLTTQEQDLDLQDTIICWAATSGTSAFRNVQTGSHFVYSLADVFMNAAYNTELQEMLEMVRKNVSSNERHLEPSGFNKAIPCWVPFTIKPLYFNVAPEKPSVS